MNTIDEMEKTMGYVPLKLVADRNNTPAGRAAVVNDNIFNWEGGGDVDVPRVFEKAKTVLKW